MKTSLFGLVAVVAPLFLPALPAFSAESTQSVTLASQTEIPGGELKPGTYTFAVEDRLPDRAIVRVSNAQDPAEHHLILTVPNRKISILSNDHLAYFKTSDNLQPLRAWQCSACPAPLEFVYPKAEAVKLTGETAQTVMAVDPVYDKLPANLSPDDMKVVTLWLLSPERVTPENTGQGVKAAKYVPPANASASPTQEMASNMPAHTRRHLPKTASNTYLYALLGLFLLGGALALRVLRTQS